MLDEGRCYVYGQLFADLSVVIWGKLKRLGALSDLNILYTVVGWIPPLSGCASVE